MSVKAQALARVSASRATARVGISAVGWRSYADRHQFAGMHLPREPQRQRPACRAGRLAGPSTASSTILDGAQTLIWPFFIAQSSSVRVSTTTQRLSRPASTQAFCSIASRSMRRCAGFRRPTAARADRARRRRRSAARPRPEARRSAAPDGPRRWRRSTDRPASDAGAASSTGRSGAWLRARTISTPSAPGPRSSFSIRTKTRRRLRFQQDAVGDALGQGFQQVQPFGGQFDGNRLGHAVIAEDAVDIVVDRVGQRARPRPRC